ncbi:cupin [Primorskyibacter flagellatus]|uniref:Cupin n=1 Tax=Primorskyibacter flagellatus TaxID=1387277 RepID=A0A917ABH3_9RHOB|nr:cupin domain-containing protein [Primorskyibacter flagellatus]GGE38586.1 cupin [Primorskyibacter flagellatus]
MIDISVTLALAGLDLGEFADKPTALADGQQEASTPLWTSPDGKVSIGIWECTPGRFTADRSKSTEFCYFLAGRIRMTRTDGSTEDLGTGDSLLLERGWTGTWEILEQTRKIYVIYGG